MKEKRTRIRRKNMGIKKLILFFILIFIIIQLIRIIVPASITFSRYVYSTVKGYYLASRGFYFNSDKLSTNNAYFEANNWSGVDEYDLTINMNSRKNNVDVSNVDIEYKVSFEYEMYHNDGTAYDNVDDLLDVSISKTISSDGYIYSTIYQSANNKDYFDITVSPKTNVTFDDDDYVYITITATSISPYKQTLSGEFKISIGNLGMSYKIEDESYSPYLEVVVTNTLNYYTVDTAFGSYSVGSNITIAEYNSLTDEQKEYCHSMIITLSFDPNLIVIDTTSSMYLLASENNDVTYTQIDDNNFVNSITFKIDAEESKVIKFYKLNASQDYTYPSGTTSPVVEVSYT